MLTQGLEKRRGNLFNALKVSRRVQNPIRTGDKIAHAEQFGEKSIRLLLPRRAHAGRSLSRMFIWLVRC
jgi:hypothetical protein